MTRAWNPGPQVREALREIAEGRTVTRSRHDLSWRGEDLSDLFRQVLEEQGYRRVTVRNLEVAPGDRVPAFVIEDGIAFFGWVFWEKFTDDRMRKLFGSVVRNAKGDWALQIPEGRETAVYAHPGLTTTMDIDFPVGLH